MNERKPRWLGDARRQTLEQHIQTIEGRIDLLKIHYNQFFAGEITTPPEKERETVEMLIRKLLSQEHRSARINLLVHNLASRFSLFNNRWLKQLNDLETDFHPRKRRLESSRDDMTTSADSNSPQDIEVSLNREDSFESVFEAYRKMMVNPSLSPNAKEAWINSLKTKMISANLVDAKINIYREDGNLKIRLKNKK